MSSFPRALPLTIATAFLMEGLDSSVVATALPAMAHDFKTTASQLAFSVTSYLISLAIFMPLGGWLSSRFGGRQVFASALGIFAVGSLLCGVAPDKAVLVIGRVVQGMGGAMMTPVGRAILIRSVPKTDYVRAMNYVIIPGLIGPASGPLLGGFLTTYASWHWIFLINLPLAAVGIIMAFRYIPAEIVDPDVKLRAFDWTGYAFLIVALGVGQTAVEMCSRGKFEPVDLVATFVAFSAGFLFYLRYRRVGYGILNLNMLNVRTFRLSIGAGSISRVGMGGVPFLLPLLLQQGFGFNPLHSGLVTFLVAIGSASMRPVLSIFLRWLGCRRLLLANSLLVALGLFGFLLFRDRATLVFIAPYVFVFGVTRSVQMSTLNAISYADIEKRDMTDASTIATLAQRLSMGWGVNIAAIMLTVSHEMGYNLIDGFGSAFVAGALLVLLAAAMLLRLEPGDGWQIIDRRPRVSG